MLKLFRNLNLTDLQLLEMLQEVYSNYYLCPAIDRIPNIWWFQRRRLNKLIQNHIDPGYRTLNHSSFARIMQLQFSGRPLRLAFLNALIEDLKDRNEWVLVDGPAAE